MGAMASHDDDVIAAINVTPFVDISLVLLIIFMVTANAISKGAFEVDLPQAAAAGSTVETTLNLVVTRDAELYLNGESVSEEELASWICAERERGASPQAVIAADQALDYGAVIRLIDLVKANGVTSFALNIERGA